MGEGNVHEVIYPQAVILPDRKTSTRGTGTTGDIGMSGAQLVFYNGSEWKLVTTN